MRRRLLSSILTVIMLVTTLAIFCMPAQAAAMGFSVSPVVLIGGGGEYNIVWENDTIGIGYVTYRYDGKTYTVYDEENGVVRSDDKMHTVRVPMEHLDKAGSYTVHAASVSSRDGYAIVTGSVATKTNIFKGYTGQKKITMGFISDSHLYYPSRNKKKYDAMMASYTKVVNEFMDRPDIMVLNGDITNELIKEEEYYGLFELIRRAGSDGTYPVLYVVGNHEKRGFYSKEIEKYLCYDTGEFYTFFEYGPLASYVVDIGEDKQDEQEEYGGLIDMERYFDEQLKYFENHPGFPENTVYKFTIGHGPGYVGNNHHTADQSTFRALFYNYGIDFHMCGHDHKLQFRQGNSTVLFHSISDGGHNNNETLRTTLLTFENGNITFKGMNDDGSQAYIKTIGAADNGSSAPKVETDKKQETITESVVTAPSPAPVIIPTPAGMSTVAIKGAADTTANITKPVVFDAGEYYSVVWQTTKGVKCAGYVDVQGITKPFMDQHGGKLRTETTHSVRIPKEAMSSGKTYTVKSRVVTNYNGYGMVENGGKNPTAYGPYATGKAVNFGAQPNGKTDSYTILAVANKTGGAQDAQKLASKYKKTPHLVVMTGDMTKALNTEKDFGKLLEYANTLTGGKTPVMLLRGENETKGAFAAYLPRILHNFSSTYNINRLYTTYSASTLSVVGLDTATTKKDSDASYNGYASFDRLRREQKTWLENHLRKSFSGDYNIVFANATDLTNCVGVDFSAGLEKQRVHLVVSAGDSAKFADGGKYYSQATIGDALGLVITCKDDEISVESVGDETKLLGTVKTANVTYAGEQTTPPIKPSPDKPKDDPDDTPENESEDTPENESDDEIEQDEKEDGKQDKPSKGDTSKKPESEGTDGSIYEDDVKEGWYLDYLKFKVKITDAEITLSGNVTEGKFIRVVARYTGAVKSKSENEAAQWAKDIGLYDGTLGANAISKDTANSIVKSMFAI